MRSFACLVTAFAAAVLAIGVAHGQATADAGALSRQIAQHLQLPLADRALAPARLGDLTHPGAPTMPVRGFRFLGNTRIPEVGLQAIVRPWVGRRAGFADLHRASQAVASAYRDRGWVARAFLPSQDLDDGIVTIEVVETGSSGTRVDSRSTDRARPDELPRRPAPRPQAGGPRDPPDRLPSAFFPASSDPTRTDRTPT